MVFRFTLPIHCYATIEGFWDLLNLCLLNKWRIHFSSCETPCTSNYTVYHHPWIGCCPVCWLSWRIDGGSCNRNTVNCSSRLSRLQSYLLVVILISASWVRSSWHWNGRGWESRGYLLQNTSLNSLFPTWVSLMILIFCLVCVLTWVADAR